MGKSLQIMVQHPCLLCILLSNKWDNHTFIHKSQIYRTSVSLALLHVTFQHQIKSTLLCSSDTTTSLLSSPPLNPWSEHSNWISAVVLVSGLGARCILWIGVPPFNTGTEAQDGGEDRKGRDRKGRDTKCAWVRRERTLCSTLLPSNTCSLSVPILTVDALLS